VKFFNPAPFARARFLYLYGVALYALLALIFILGFPDISDIARSGNQFVIDGKVKLYWGVFFGPVFLAFAVPPALRALGRVRDLTWLEILLLLCLAVNLTAFAAGVVMGNDLRYLAGDTLVFSIIPLSYFFVNSCITNVEQIKKFFYLMLAVLFLFIVLPVTFGVAPPRVGTTSIGLYTFHSTEAFVTAALMALAIFSKRRWIFIGLFVAVVTSALFRTKNIYAIQVIIAVVVIFLVHATDKGFIKRFATSFLVAFFLLFSLWEAGFFKSTLLYRRSSERAGQIARTLYSTVSQLGQSPGMGRAATQPDASPGIGKGRSGADSTQVADGPVIKVSMPKWSIMGLGSYGIESTVKKVGEVSLGLSGTAPERPYYANQRISNYRERYFFDGKRVAFGAWVYSTIPGKLHLGIVDFTDGFGFTYSPHHSGSGEWEFLTVSRVIRSKSEFVDVQIFAEHGAQGYFDGAVAVEGEVSVDALKAMSAPGNELLEGFTVVVTDDMALSQRFYEAGLVKARFKGGQFWNYLFGFGNGATIDLSDTPDITLRYVYKDRVSKVHAIHLLPVALLYRQGLVGLLVFTSLCLAMAVLFVRMIKYFKTQGECAIITEALFIGVFLTLFAGMTATPHFFTSITAGFSLGLIGVVKRDLPLGLKPRVRF
jgi:hypothetical protein